MMALLLLMSSAHAAKQIAITFDDAPRSDTSLSSKERTESLMIALLASGVDQAMFFVTTQNLNESNKPVLDQYHKDGHLIANHSHQHLWLHKTEVKEFQQDFMTAHDMIKDYPHFKPFFRYPYLDQGRDKKVVKKMRRFLKKKGYQHGYITIDNYDWYIDKLYQDAVKAGHQINMHHLKQLYLDVMMGAINHYDQIAMDYLGRSPKHVLLLHENDVASFFVGELVSLLKAEGWEIISPLEAYQDPIAEQTPQTLMTGQGRVAALAIDAGAQPADMVHEAEDEVYLLQMFKRYAVATPMGEAVPNWYSQLMSTQVGTWKASNAQYQSEAEPISDYVMEWTWGIGEQSLNGRLYGIVDGVQTADFWTYKQYWDPVNKQAKLLQFGYGGRLGEASIQLLEDNQIEVIKVLSGPDSQTIEERHLNLYIPEGMLTTTFRKNFTGQWEGSRSHTWYKQPQSD